MRIGFVTCVELGQSCIRTILDLGGRLDLLVTLQDDQSPNKAGRIYLDSLAHESRTPLLRVRNINDIESVDALREAELDWLFIVGWSQIAREPVLAAPKLGCLGMHPTLLPEGRGRAAVPWAILKGLSRTGVTLFKLDSGVDTGPIIDQIAISIDRGETATTLYDKVGQAHMDLIAGVWESLVSGNVSMTPQDESKATVWPGRRPSDGRFLRHRTTVSEVEVMVRALTHPYPGAFTEMPGGECITIWAGSDTPPLDTPSFLEIPVRDGTYYATEWTHGRPEGAK